MIRRFWGGVLVLLGVWSATASAQSDCQAALTTFWTAASEACVGKASGYFCNGGSAPYVEPQGAVSNALSSRGALVEPAVVAGLRTAPFSADGLSGGVLWLRLGGAVPLSILVLGDVSMVNLAPAGSPAWSAWLMATGAPATGCAALPTNGVVVQTPFGQAVTFTVNGLKITLDGALLLRSEATWTVLDVLSGQASVQALDVSRSLRAGEQVRAPYQANQYTTPISAPSEPAPYDLNALARLPVALFERPLLIPQPGYAVTARNVNLRAAPSTEALSYFEVPAGTNLNALGRDASGQWLHVVLETGVTGWMLRELLEEHLGELSAVYEATPTPPQRYGRLGSSATIFAPAGVQVRAAPDISFPVLGSVPNGATVTLVARSPYSPWLKIDYAGLIGWVGLVTLHTEAVIDALPLDFSVPTPPEPTIVPGGGFGNAFPDPRRPGN